jgi:pimeloyl-ACP methyl ester carboxylesterase
MSRKSIVFIHGAFVTPSCWDRLAGWFGERGYQVHAPAWPGKEGTAAEIRAAPDRLAGIGLGEILDRYGTFVGTLDQPPILIGHSFGGLVVQVLLDCGLGSAGVAIHPAPPRGVPVYHPSTVRSLAHVLARPRNRRGIVQMSFAQWRYAFAHTLPQAQARAAYDQHVTPETGRPFFQTAFSLFHRHSPARVDFRTASRPPLLLIAGGKDHIIPASLTRANYRKYRRSSARTDYHEFPDRVHWTIAQDGWQQVAIHIEQWLTSIPTGQQAPSPDDTAENGDQPSTP